MKTVLISLSMVLIIVLTVSCSDGVKPKEPLETDPLEDNVIEEIDLTRATFAIGEWAPYTSEEMDDYGVAAELVKLAYENVGIEVEYAFYPWTRAMEMTRKGEVLGTFPWAKTVEREQDFVISKPFFESHDKFLYMKNNAKMPSVYESPESLDGLVITNIQGYAMVEVLNDLKIPFEISNNEVDAYNKLIRGRVDTIPINEWVAIEYFRIHEPEMVDQIAFLEPPVMSFEMGILMAKDYPNTEYYVQKFNEGLDQLIKSGKYNELLIKYGFEKSVLAE